MAYRYTGRHYDPLTGLYHYRMREYDPSLGRFLQEDPIWFAAGDLNVYRYTWNNPQNWTDPTGLTATENAGLLGIILGTTAKLALIADRINCTFNIVAGALRLANQGVGVAGTVAGSTWRACGAIPGLKRLRINKCKLRGLLGAAKALSALSFGAGTGVMTRDGLIAIEEVPVGAMVAA